MADEEYEKLMAEQHRYLEEGRLEHEQTERWDQQKQERSRFESEERARHAQQDRQEEQHQEIISAMKTHSKPAPAEVSPTVSAAVQYQKTKQCPFCCNKILFGAIKCQYCHSFVRPGICMGCEKQNSPEARVCGFCGSSEIINDHARLEKERIESMKAESMVLIPAGGLLMGSPEGEGALNEHPQHEVCLEAFYIDKYLVTVVKYKLFCADAGFEISKQPDWSTAQHPVMGINWDEAAAYCKWAGGRLPTEAEWEKASRGIITPINQHPIYRSRTTRGAALPNYCFGNDISQLGAYAWYRDNSKDQAHPVGEKKPNEYGLFDMHGNVWEWVSDWYNEDYYTRSPEKNPAGPDSGTCRVLRGGAFNTSHDMLRSASRTGNAPGSGYPWAGFRCVVPA
ncbi:MAG: SUMF1/EgtB/PvdO family nonheme iron enzyme [Elusimicrobiota bacterium]|nr:SUMF1/EgtB/PvdO family nonheme iron enzyme [Elusimicrobiota bacterium]